MKQRFRKILKSCISLTVAAVLILTSCSVCVLAVSSQNLKTEQELLVIWKPFGGYVHEQKFTNDFYLKGLFSQCTEYFNTGDWEINDAAFVLSYSSTQLLQQEVSQLTISLNGEPVYSGKIPATNGVAQQMIISLPKKSIKKDSANSLLIEAYLRGEAAEVCSDDISGSKWLNIFKDSKTLISYKPKATCDNIAQLYKQFTSIDALENNQSAICISKGANESILTSAAITASGISGNAVLAYDKIALTSIASLSELEKYKYSIYISSYDKLLPEITQLLNDEQKLNAQNGAVCAFVKLKNANILVVTGINLKLIEAAGTMLSNKSYSLQLNTATKVITDLKEYVFQAQAPQQYMALTEVGRYLKGSYRQSTDFNIEYPANRTIAPSSEISLDFRYSENLNFERSLVTVYIDNIPIGSKKLEKDKAKKDNAVFTFPEDIELTGSFTVKVAFDLDVGDDWCKLSHEEMPWGYISETSMLKLNSTDNARMIFENYPSPFLRDGTINETVVVVPNEPSPADLEVLRLLMLTIGQFEKDNGGTLNVVFSSNYGQLESKNVIAIGRIENNKIAKEQAEKLYFKFDEAGSTMLSNNKMLIGNEYGKLLGTAQLLDSPYSKRLNSLLIISGVADDGMLKAAEYLGSTNKLWKLSGDGYAADKDEAHCFIFKHDKTIKPTPTTEQVVVTKNVYGFILVAGTVIMLCILALILMMIKYTRGKR